MRNCGEDRAHFVVAAHIASAVPMRDLRLSTGLAMRPPDRRVPHFGCISPRLSSQGPNDTWPINRESGSGRELYDSSCVGIFSESAIFNKFMRSLQEIIQRGHLIGVRPNPNKTSVPLAKIRHRALSSIHLLNFCLSRYSASLN